MKSLAIVFYVPVKTSFNYIEEVGSVMVEETGESREKP